MRLYISGPMSGCEDHNFPAFNVAEHDLLAAGYQVSNPADKGIINGWRWEDYLRYDLKVLLDVDGVANLPGSQNSPGARLENYVARMLDMPCYDVAYWIEISRRGS